MRGRASAMPPASPPENRCDGNAAGGAVEPARADDAAARRARSETRRGGGAPAELAPPQAEEPVAPSPPSSSDEPLPRTSRAQGRAPTSPPGKRARCVNGSEDGDANLIERSARPLSRPSPASPACACRIRRVPTAWRCSTSWLQSRAEGEAASRIFTVLTVDHELAAENRARKPRW